MNARRLWSVSQPPPSRRVFVCVGLLPAPSSSRFTAPLTALHRATFLWSCTHTHIHTHTPCSCGRAKPLTVCLMLNRSSWLAVVFLPITPFSPCVHLFNYCLLFLLKHHVRNAPSYRGSIWILQFYNYRLVCFAKLAVCLERLTNPETSPQRLGRLWQTLVFPENESQRFCSSKIRLVNSLVHDRFP